MVSRSANRRTLRTRVIPLAALGVLALGGLALGSAAHLTVTATDRGIFFAEPCTFDTVTVGVSPTGIGATKTAVAVTNFPSSCYGNTVQVTVANAAGTQLATGSGTCSAASCTITTGSYDAPSVTQTHLLVSTWGVPSTWGTTCYHIIFFWWCS